MEIINKDKRQKAIIRSVALFSAGFAIMGFASYNVVKGERHLYTDAKARLDTCVKKKEPSSEAFKKLAKDTLLLSNRLNDSTQALIHTRDTLAAIRDTFLKVCLKVDSLNNKLSTRQNLPKPPVKKPNAPIRQPTPNVARPQSETQPPNTGNVGSVSGYPKPRTDD